MNHHAEIVVESGNNVERSKNRKYRMVCLDERKKDEVLAHETRGGRNAGERKHEDQEQHRGRRTALVEAVEVVEFIADEAALAKYDDHSEGPDGHERVGDQVIENAGDRGLVCRNKAEQDVAHMRD